MAHADKRTVATDALETLGTVIGLDEKRDAIHLAVEPVTAAGTLKPGTHVGFVGPGIAGKCDKPVGIVDPFLAAPVKKGERFWLVVYPRQITSLRHVWTHPGFPESEIGEDFDVTSEAAVNRITQVRRALRREESEAWLRAYCEANSAPSYETLMELLRSGKIVDHGVDSTPSAEDLVYGYVTNYGTEEHPDRTFFVSGTDAHADIPPEFWDHVENVLGRTVPENERATSFSCSC